MRKGRVPDKHCHYPLTRKFFGAEHSALFPDSGQSTATIKKVATQKGTEGGKSESNK